jgi:arylsulfatase A-like enzyme
MPQPFRGSINVDIRDSTPDWTPFEPPKAPEGAPNVVYIVLDDVGYSAMSCYGGPIPTPNIDRIAAQGARFTQWHTTALCSPTRSSLLTGRNHTRNSMACITEAAIGFPNGSGTIPPENGMLPEILGEQGWNTYMVGKWHLCPTDEMTLASTRRNWPSGRGFERWYGFLGAETNQWFPDLVYDNHFVDQPKTPEEGYHLTEDLTDKALEFIKDSKAVVPEKPFFLYYSPGACHAPHHAPKEWIEKFKGRFDQGYEAIREETLARQKELGLVPADTELPPINPIGTPDTRTGPDGQPFPALDFTRPWDSLNDDEKALFARMAEVYAGMLGHVDHHIGRLLDYIEESGELDNTIIVVVSDNGASGEGGPNGSVNEMKFANGVADTLEANLAQIDDLGGPLTYNHYPTGWAMAFNTPFKMWKRYEFNGGTSDPCIISWPAGSPARGEIREQYHHAVDIVPTLLDMLDVEAPDTIKGHTQSHLDGMSMRPSLTEATAAFPLDDRSAVEIFATERPQLTKPRNRYVYRPGTAPVSEWLAPKIAGRSYVVGALVDIPAPGAEGVLFAHGSRFGGHALYIKDNRLHYVSNYVGTTQLIVGDTDVPVGDQVLLAASFEKASLEPEYTSGTLTLFHGDDQVGEAQIKTQLGAFAIAGAALFVGRHSGEPVTDDYPGEAPYTFTGGTIDRVGIDVSGEPFVDLEREAALMLMRE